LVVSGVVKGSIFRQTEEKLMCPGEESDPAEKGAAVQLQNPIGWHPDDISNAIAVIRTIPRDFVDSVNGLTDEAGFHDYIEQFQRDLLQAIPSTYISEADGLPYASYYLVPPAAGPYLEVIFRLAEDVNSVVQTLDAYIGPGLSLAEFLRVRRQRDDTLEGESHPRLRDYPFVTIRCAEALCLHHAHRHYYDPERHPRLRVDSYARNVFIGTVERPVADVQYVITVTIGQVGFLYVMRADCRVLEHARIERGMLVGLPKPDWHGDAPASTEGEIVVRDGRMFDGNDRSTSSRSSSG
jgi:hypothetical protein